VPAPSADGNAGEHAKCEHGTIDLGRLRATARFDRRSMKAQYIAETKPEDTLQLLVGPFYKTSLENARIAMSKQPSVVPHILWAAISIGLFAACGRRVGLWVLLTRSSCCRRMSSLAPSSTRRRSSTL
jgi:hypothetical protein